MANVREHAYHSTSIRHLRAALRSDRPFSQPTQMSCDLNRVLIRQHELRSLEQHLMLRRADLPLDDVDGQVLLVATGEPGCSVPEGDGALVGIHGAPGCSKSSAPSMSTKVSGGLSQPMSRWLTYANAPIGAARVHDPERGVPIRKTIAVHQQGLVAIRWQLHHQVRRPELSIAYDARTPGARPADNPCGSRGWQATIPKLLANDRGECGSPLPPEPPVPRSTLRNLHPTSLYSVVAGRDQDDVLADKPVPLCDQRVVFAERCVRPCFHCAATLGLFRRRRRVHGSRSRKRIGLRRRHGLRALCNPCRAAETSHDGQKDQRPQYDINFELIIAQLMVFHACSVAHAGVASQPG